MPCYHMTAKVIGRSAGRSATAAAAYRSASRIEDARTGLVHDYERKGGVVRDEVLLPRDAPERWLDRSELWNAVEAAERRKDSQLAREFELALPRELDRGEQWELARGWAERELVSRGMCADVCMHDKGDGNPHAHVMATTRELGPDGFGAKNRDWNDRALLEHWRESWERDQNAALERAYERARTPEAERAYVDCRSYEARGVDREPTRHEGPAVRAVEDRERGRCAAEGREYEPVTERARENERVRERNAAMERVRQALEGARRRMRELADRLRELNPHRERMERDVARVRAIVEECDRRGGLTASAMDAYDGLSRRERGMLHRELPEGSSRSLDALRDARHRERPLVERSPAPERQRGTRPRDAARAERDWRERGYVAIIDIESKRVVGKVGTRADDRGRAGEGSWSALLREAREAEGRAAGGGCGGSGRDGGRDRADDWDWSR